MGGLFGGVSQKDCVKLYIFGTDYHISPWPHDVPAWLFEWFDVHRAIHNIEKHTFRAS